jgi:sulfhydrogenase subunit alpha
VTHKSVHVPAIGRVEGEGALHVTIRDGEIEDLRLEIYEPPRFFESFLTGRHVGEVSDIVARICGICPVAYQMTALHGLERLFGTTVPAGTRELRRLLYCGEWIESHMLHVFLLAAPDYLGYDNVIEMARGGHRERVEQGLAIKRLGNDIMAAIGGREIHPVSPRLGGFSHVPERRKLAGFQSRIEDLLGRMSEIAAWTASFESPRLPRPAEMVAMVNPDEYPMNEGSLRSTTDRSFDAASFEDTVEELQVSHSNALHSRMRDTGTSYFLGPLARVNLNARHLTPIAREVALASDLSVPESDPFFSMAARLTETTLALEEAGRLIRDYEPPDPPAASVEPIAGRATWVTEAPRGTIYHRYDVAADGSIAAAKIIPPTSQNLRHMEDDLRTFLPAVLDHSEEQLTRECEMVIRNYDPCISCATHFLNLELESIG